MILTFTKTKSNSNEYGSPYMSISQETNDMSMEEFYYFCKRSALALGYPTQTVESWFNEDE